MRVTIAVERPFHSVMLANALHQHGASVQILSSTPRRFFRGLSCDIPNRLVPSPLVGATYLLQTGLPEVLGRIDVCIFDRMVARALPKTDIFIGWATQCEYSARAVERRGIPFILDRACPHFDAQQAIVHREVELLGGTFSPQPAWFRERQAAEYEMAQAILVPSEYTARSFPHSLRSKLVKAPLMGRCKLVDPVERKSNGTFTVGVVGGSAIRKGYIYLLRAWQKLKLPNARLLLRGGGDFASYPVLNEALKGLPNVDRVEFVPNLSDFFKQCDAFVLPSVDDGFGMALFEAMNHGVASIATTHCGASELLDAGRDALVVEPASEDQLANALLRLYESEDLRHELASSGRQATIRVMKSQIYDSAIQQLVGSIEGIPAAALRMTSN